MSERLRVEVADVAFEGELLAEEAPVSVDTLRRELPLDSELMHVRWSGYAVWINVDEFHLERVPRENHTVYPSRGDVLLYPGFENEQEILIACGPTCFKSPAGELAGNHVATLEATREELAALEIKTLREGVQPVTVGVVDD